MLWNLVWDPWFHGLFTKQQLSDIKYINLIYVYSLLL